MDDVVVSPARSVSSVWILIDVSDQICCELVKAVDLFFHVDRKVLPGVSTVVGEASMAVASGAIKSTLNPNAPLFIPAAYQEVEDFSPQWWELVKTNTWYREYWFHEHQEQETFDGDDEEDIANLLPDSFDLGITEDFSNFQPQLEEVVYQQLNGAEVAPSKKGLESEAEKLIKSLSLKSPKNGGVRPVLDPAKYREKPLQTISAKSSPRCIIQQPR
ncbi:hypothetical protein Taro_021627 [Colocasia esculenta]|uniref:Uncharacterized protein n=1 Tax=Colocasia esculenta TaxID=4460 RepID=A0A843V2Y3_COLES|nr:hypothetical protein [Colocasia esculenta]